ncbi:aspartyl/asparaginyl beta-hydroxylase domain-containing protein [Novosphingobium sp. NBM11]|uniref:aspartyl/asparaginyl beta-hydroxylase domain-containing protein n=1 Tax=Novosphingobium sp. NBM11 TaxID=2596914 RepID=UPI0018922C89|nr:aspartyl/asparaginyl beta-hydroxylase domain-containing protein [Novosphingobium sp. NBM11]
MMPAAPDPGLLAQADALVRQGDLPGGAGVLEQALSGGGGAPAHWLQLAGLRRAMRQPRRALDAVQQALALAPLDFLALVLRASLLEQMGDDHCGQAWDEALAQRPSGDLGATLTPVVTAGEKVRDAWLRQREDMMRNAIRAQETAADGDTLWRMNRFRDNILHKTKVFHSEPTHFHYPGLVEREFHPREHFPWLSDLEAATDAIREEMRTAMASERSELLPYIQYQDHEALAQWRPLNRNRDWTAIHLLRQGQAVAQNAGQCPVTMELLGRLSQPDIAGASPNAMFSLLAPNTAIPPHVGVNNARLVCHLPLVVPDGCWFRVGAETRFWREGEAFVFDDTIEHEAMNPSDRLRVVLIFDVWHPGLTELEQSAVSAVIATEVVDAPRRSDL